MVLNKSNTFEQMVIKRIVTDKYIFDNGTLCFADGFYEPLEPYFNIMFQASHIIFPHVFSGPIITFPNTTHLEISHTNYPLELSPNIQVLNIRTFYMYILKLPLGIESLYIFGCASQLELNKNMRNLNIDDTYDYTMRLNKLMYCVRISYHSNSSLVSNKKLNAITVGFLFNQPLELPKCLTELTVGFDFNQKILLPRSIIHLSVECKSTRNFVLESGTKDYIYSKLYICVRSKDQYLIDNLPDCKNGIVLKHSLNNVHNLPKKSIVRGFY